MLELLELEETVGRAWHRLVGETRSMPSYPASAVRLQDVAPIIATCFRGFGGDRALQVVPAQMKTSRHRLRLRQLIGIGEERLARPGRDFSRLMLPETIDFFPDRDLNRDAYVWIAAATAALRDARPQQSDPLLQDLARLADAKETVSLVLHRFPGLVGTYRRLCFAMLAGRGRRPLPAVEALVENRITNMLRDGAGLGPATPPAIFPRRAPAGYLPMMGVPLWPEFLHLDEVAPSGDDREPEDNRTTSSEQSRRFGASRETGDGARRDPFILNRFEKILSMAEMVNVDRPTDDDTDQNSQAADDLDEMVLGRRKERPSSTFRFDLDLPPALVDLARTAAVTSYPEWDYRKREYLREYCSVMAVEARSVETVPDANPETLALIRKVRRQFEAMRPRQEIWKSQLDGSEIDLDAVVRRSGDLAAGGDASDRVHMLSRSSAYDLAVTTLVDVSLSTDAWVDNRRVLDVEKEALEVFAHGLAACGTDHSILTFTSRRNSLVKIETVKSFEEPVSAAVKSRIEGLTPGYYTRLGAALRHACAQIKRRSNRTKLILLLTDGKPNDVDHYEGRFALEDTRRAVQEARRSGVNVFAVTVDKDAKSYLPLMFGRNGFSVVADISKLPAALPVIYRGITA